MAKILIAASPEPRAILQRMLHEHELICADTMAHAEKLLEEHGSFDQIVCTIVFDESRMLDLLQLVQSKPKWKHIPFVCARTRPTSVHSAVALESIGIACKAMGAASFLNITDYKREPEHEMRKAIEQLLKYHGKQGRA